MADWRMARSLEQLRTQLNELAPNRSKVSDGGVGDLSHQNRNSDHNPRWLFWSDRPIVTARDFTHDPDGGLDCQRLFLALLTSRDTRIKYVIWRGQITSGAEGPQPWVPRPYTGTNPHDKHLHVSVVSTTNADSDRPWFLRFPSPTHLSRPTIRRGDTGVAVELIQRFLGVVAHGEPGYGTFGPKTEKAVKRYQAMRGLTADGVVGPATWQETGL